MRPCIGIDNGCSGAVAWIHGENIGAKPMETWIDGKDTCINELWLRDFLSYFHQPFILVEKAQKFSPGKLALCSTWNSWATIRTVLRLSSYDYRAITPQMWQRTMLGKYAAGDTKAVSIARAKELFPGVSLLRSSRCRTDDDGMSDALLTAAFAQKLLQQTT